MLSLLAATLATLPHDRPPTWRLGEAMRLILHTDGVAITMEYVSDSRTTVCASDDVAAALEDLQEVAGEGPGYDAVREGVVVVRPVGRQRRWLSDGHHSGLDLGGHRDEPAEDQALEQLLSRHGTRHQPGCDHDFLHRAQAALHDGDAIDRGIAEKLGAESVRPQKPLQFHHSVIRDAVRTRIEVEQVLVCGGNQKSSSGTQHAVAFYDEALDGRQVIERLEEDHDIERSIRVGQGLCVEARQFDPIAVMLARDAENGLGQVARAQRAGDPGEVSQARPGTAGRFQNILACAIAACPIVALAQPVDLFAGNLVARQLGDGEVVRS
jgi:hypothetical protein